MWNRLSSSKADQLAPLQFAYKAHRHTGSVFVTDDNMLAKLLQQTKYAQILLVDFFKKLLELIVNGGFLYMIKAFLNKHKQIGQYIINIPTRKNDQLFMQVIMSQAKQEIR